MIINEKYYIHENQDGTFAIWSIDDNIEMCGGFKTRKEAEKILAIMPHSIVIDKNEVINDNKARTR